MRGLILVAVLGLAFASAQALACDWVVSHKIDPMTDIKTCYVSSESAKITFYRYGSDRPNVAVASAYSRTHLQIRIDDNPAIRMGDDAWTRGNAIDALLPQLESGSRIRTQFSDYPRSQNGDGEVCNLPELLRAC